jgi:SAM-dependent methyltransferase
MARGNYGIDAPTIVRNLALGGAACIAVSLAHLAFPGLRPLRGLLWPGASLALTALWMVVGSKVLKLAARDRLIARAAPRAGERVLDVGCGRGLLLIAAAKRVSAGDAVGIDLWRTVDQSGNDPSVTRANAAAEGVADKIALETGDFTAMPFGDGTFDVAVSSWAIHNVPTAAGREQALREVVRVLKPGGRLEILDIGPGRGYDAVLRAAGMVAVERALDNLVFLIPTWRISARKPV